MNIEYKQRYCPACTRYVRAEKVKQSNLLHLFMTVITGGIWIFVWIMRSFSTDLDSWQCPFCGSKKTKSSPPKIRTKTETLPELLLDEALSGLKGLIILVAVILVVITVAAYLN